MDDSHVNNNKPGQTRRTIRSSAPIIRDDNSPRNPRARLKSSKQRYGVIKLS